MKKIGLLITAVSLLLAFSPTPGFADHDNKNLPKPGFMMQVAQGGNYADICRVLGQHRSTQRRRPRGREDEDRLVADMIELVRQCLPSSPLGHIEVFS